MTPTRSFAVFCCAIRRFTQFVSAAVLRTAAVLLFALATLALGGPALCQTTIFDTARNGDLAMVQTLLKGNPDLANARTKDAGFVGVTALMLAAQAGHIGCVNALIAVSADVNARKDDAKNDANNSGWTALMLAALGGHADCVEALIAAGVDVNAKKGYDGTALMEAASQGHADCVKALIAAGADVNAKNSAGDTALIVAARAGHAACVAALKAASSALKPRVMTLEYPSPDYALALAVASQPPYGAVADGKTDCTAAIQAAIDASSEAGGGVVFLPAGRYLVAGGLVLRMGVTLRGDWKAPDPEKGDLAVGGTVLMATGGRGDAGGAPLISLQSGGCVRNLSVWYPDQSASDPAPYPWTISSNRSNGGLSLTVENVTFVNSYQAIRLGWVNDTSLGMVRNVYGTPLKSGILIDRCGDVGRIQRIRFGAKYWIQSGLGDKPDAAALKSLLAGAGTAIELLRTDAECLYDVAIDGYRTGIHFGRGETGNSYGPAYGVSITDCDTGLVIDEANNLTGWQFARCSIDARTVAVSVGPNFQSTLQFNGCRLMSSGPDALRSDGGGLIQLQNCVVGGSLSMTGYGSLNMLACGLARRNSYVMLGPLVMRALIAGGIPRSAVLSYGGGDIQVDPAPLESATLEGAPPLSLPPDPRPASPLLFNVVDYGAVAGGGALDNTAAFQRALDAAAGGGTVYVPAGEYRFTGSFTVPSGVELRGSFDAPHHTSAAGTLLMPTAGRGDEAGTPFISLSPGSGLRGLTVYYPDQRVDDIAVYPWTVRAMGPGCWLLDVTGSDAYRFVDFGSHPSDGSLLRDVDGAPLNTGIWVSKGSCEVDNCHFNDHFWLWRYKGGPPLSATNTDSKALQNMLWSYMSKNLDGYVFGDCPNTLQVDNFVIPDAHGLRFVADSGKASSGWVIGHGSDLAAVGLKVDAVGEQGLRFVDTQLAHAAPDAPACSIEIADSCSGDTIFYNGFSWGLGTAWALKLFGRGHTTLQCWNLDTGGVQAGVGDVTLQGVACRTAGWGGHFGIVQPVKSVRIDACSTADDEFSVDRLPQVLVRDVSRPVKPIELNDRFASSFGPGQPAPTNGVESSTFPNGGITCGVVPGAGPAAGPAVVLDAELPVGAAHSAAVYRLFDLGALPVRPDTIFRYWMKPGTPISRYCCVDLVFTDGSILRGSGIADMQGRSIKPATARGVPGKWTMVQTMIGSVEAGKSISQILLIYDNDHGDSGHATVAIGGIEIGEPR